MNFDSSQPTVLLIEDDLIFTEIYLAYLENEQVKLTRMETGTKALEYLQKNTPTVILLDLGLPDMNGMEILEHVQQRQLSSNVIIVTADNSIEIVVKAMRYGAFDFLEKPLQKNRLIVTLRNALQHNVLSQKVDFYKNKLKQQRYNNIIGISQPMQAVYHIIGNIAKSNASVLITGETGTGKELCAQAIHKESQRKDKPFIAINCAAITKDLMESGIFGHVKGAFTGAMTDRQGAASMAKDGTLFLDEIGDMDLMLQSKLLRFVQEGTFYKVGSDKLEKMNIRFVCATNRDLRSDIKFGRFREDLYYRLNVVPIFLPPLREREDDILLLARIFLKEYVLASQKSFKAFSPEVEQIFLRYEWPGNIREMQNLIERVVLLNNGQMVTTDMLPTYLFEVSSSLIEQRGTPLSTSHVINTPPKVIRSLEEVEKKAILEAIKFYQGNIIQAATLLEISPATIYRRLKKWGIPPTSFES